MPQITPELDSPLAGFITLQREMEDGLPAEETPLAVEPPALLPVRLGEVEKSLASKDVAIKDWVLSLVEVMNFHANMGKCKLGPPTLTAAQELMVTRLYETVKRFVDKGGKVPKFLDCVSAVGSAKFDYAGEPIQYMEELVAEKVVACWPKPGEAAIQDATDFVPPEVRQWLDHPELCLLPQAAWPDKPPVSRVRATDEQWEIIVKAGVERGMMCQVSPEQLFRDQNGVPILNGAGAVKKVKTIGGEEKTLQRFISILVPSNTYQVHMVADDAHLPYLGQMAMMEIDTDEEVLIDSEDLVSCFNLFRLPPQWAGYCTFAKQVKASVFGGSPSEMTFVGMRVVPMGWINSVSLMQTVVRRLVFGLSKIPESSEVSKLKWFPTDDSISVVYLDSYDEVRKVSAGCREALEGGTSARHLSFVKTCDELKLPLNQGKRLVGVVRGTLQGGDIDGAAGTFEASHDKKVSVTGLAAALLGLGKASEFDLRHFVGKAIFAMAFRRPTMSFLEEIFVDISKARGGHVTLSRRTMDEIYTTLVMLPLMVMNLRAQFDPEVTITDASPTGGGGAVSKEFKHDPDMTSHDGKHCFVCERDLEAPRSYPCPAGCGVAMCSLSCIQKHREGDCRRRDYIVPKFGERFSGPNAPLSHAVARIGGIEVQPPFDILRGDDFFSQEGKDKLAELESDPALACERWAPECKLFSRARGRPVNLPDGRTIAGPQPVRDQKHVMGYPWADTATKIALRKSNNMALRGLRRMQSPFGTNRYVTLEHPYNSWLWYFNMIEALREAGFEFACGSNCCFEGEREKWFALLNNTPEIQRELHRPTCPGHVNLRGYEATFNADGTVRYATEEEAEYKPLWCQGYARGLRRQLEPWIQRSHLDGRCRKVEQELLTSTTRLSDPPTANAVANEVMILESGMRRGGEVSHLKEMARRTSIRGSDLRLFLTGEAVEVPYPAFRWRWKEVLSYAWREERHINQGEISAFNVMLKRRTKDPSKHEMRYLAVLDSMVTRGAVSKGRSPSKPINRLLRQTAALTLASDQLEEMPEHLRFAGLQRRTIRAYRISVEKFYVFVKIHRLSLSSKRHLDSAVAEYLNALFQEGDSLAQAGHLLSGLKRFCPDLRSKLPEATQYFKNWQKIHRPERAIPISWDLAQALAGVSLTLGNPGVALMMLLGFFCFLRTAEMLSLQFLHVILHHTAQRITLIIPFAKTSNGNPQVILCDDVRLFHLAKSVKATAPPTSFLWPGTPTQFRQFWGALIEVFGFSPDDYSPYGLRRGGATWYFLESGSMDATLHRGRWACGRTARQYIDQGTLAMARFFWAPSQRRKVRRWALKGAKQIRRLRQAKCAGKWELGCEVLTPFLFPLVSRLRNPLRPLVELQQRDPCDGGMVKTCEDWMNVFFSR
eukprot:s2664_g6.t1